LGEGFWFPSLSGTVFVKVRETGLNFLKARKNMRKNIHPLISYAMIIIGATFLASIIFFISKTAVPNMVWNNNNKITATAHKPATPQEVYGIKNDIVNKSELFADSALQSKINITPGHFTFNEILSNSGNKIVYAELSDCPDDPAYSNCAWDYSIKIFDPSKEQPTTIYTKKVDKESLPYAGIIYYPIAWSKNDKKIILSWYNLYFFGQDFSPPKYSLLDVNGGEIENPGAFIDCNATIFDFNTQAITATDKNGGVLCAEGDYSPSLEQIIITNAETEKTTVVVNKKSGYGLAIKSFDPITGLLVYTTFPCKETGQMCEATEGGGVITKQIKVLTK
jgi:hypothetical protein